MKCRSFRLQAQLENLRNISLFKWKPWGRYATQSGLLMSSLLLSPFYRTFPHCRLLIVTDEHSTKPLTLEKLYLITSLISGSWHARSISELRPWKWITSKVWLRMSGECDTLPEDKSHGARQDAFPKMTSFCNKLKSTDSKIRFTRERRALWVEMIMTIRFTCLQSAANAYYISENKSAKYSANRSCDWVPKQCWYQ